MMGELFDVTLQRTKKLRAKLKGHSVIEIWEQEWIEQMKEDPLAQNIVSEFKVEEPIAPGDVLYGGRTEAIRSLYDQNIDVGQGKYLAFMSLYPSVNKYAAYPVGHPTILTCPDVRNKTIHEYFGLVKAKVLTPRDLLMPVMHQKKAVATLKRRGGLLVFGSLQNFKKP